MEDTSKTEADKGPTETLRDDEKADAGKVVPGAEGVPGAQKSDNQEIKHEINPNTE